MLMKRLRGDSVRNESNVTASPATDRFEDDCFYSILVRRLDFVWMIEEVRDTHRRFAPNKGIQTSRIRLPSNWEGILSIM